MPVRTTEIMNKLTIPSILAATVLIAGIFAFMPVEKASTVHTSLGTMIGDVQTTADNIETMTSNIETTITEKASALRILELTDNTQEVNDEYTLDCTTDYTIIGIATNMTGVTETEADLITVNGEDVAVDFSSATTDGRSILDTGNIVALADEDLVITVEDANPDADTVTVIRVSVLATNAGMCTLLETTPAS